MNCNHCGCPMRCQCGESTDRERFIRAAAIAIVTKTFPDGSAVPPDAAWAAARVLWDTKPDDC